MSFKQIQEEHKEWAARNFGTDRKAYQPILGAAEEIGELSHAYLKMEQGIRGTKEEHVEAMKDAVADCSIFLMDLCNMMGWNYQELVQQTWDQVKSRDWNKNAQGVGY